MTQPDHVRHTLEDLQLDQATEAPQLDQTLETPEYDQSKEGLQVDRSVEDGLQLDRSDEMPIWVEGPFADGLELKVNEEVEITAKHRVCGIPSTIFWVSALIICITALAVSLGVVLKTKGTTAAQPASSFRPSTYISGTLTSRTNVPQPTSLPSAPPGPLLPKDTMMNDSSLAAFATPNGVSRLFFQDDSGNICLCIRYNDGEPWQPATRLDIPDARDHTPLTVTGQGAVQVPDWIHLFYITKDNHIGTWTFFQGVWNPTPSSSPPFSIQTSSRILAASVLSSLQVYTVLLFYESPAGVVSLMNGTLGKECANRLDVNLCPPQNPSWNWQNSSSVFYDQLNNGSNTLSAPFASIDPNSLTGGKYGIDVIAMFLGSGPDGTQIFPLNYLQGEPHFTIKAYPNMTSDENPTIQPMAETPVNKTAIQSSDFLLVPFWNDQSINFYGLWVNQSEISYFYKGETAPELVTAGPGSQFPYSRLASLNPENGPTFSLYHQIDGTAFAEDVWDGPTATLRNSTKFSIGWT